MALEIAAVIDRMIDGLMFESLANNPAAQFGVPSRTYLGATFLPERSVVENMFSESGIRYRSVIANDGTRYSPVQLKKSLLTGSFEVRLGHQDTGSHFTAEDYDSWLRLLKVSNGFNDRPAMTAISNLLNWAEMTLTRPLREKIEKQRWDALLYAKVVRSGDNGYQETVLMPNPPGHRINSGDWSDDTYDPYDDIIGRVELLKKKGYTCNRIVMDTPSLRRLSLNAKIRQRLGLLSVVGGLVTGLRGRAQIGDINGMLADDGIPSIETYDLAYQKDIGTDYFFSRGSMFFAATTGRDTELILGPDQAPVVLENTLGYVAIGRPAGQSEAGRVVKVESFDRKPPRIEGETWQASFPVIQDVEAISVLLNIPV